MTPRPSSPAHVGKGVQPMAQEPHWLTSHVIKYVAAGVAFAIVMAILTPLGNWLLGLIQSILSWLGESVEIARWHYLLVLIGSIALLLLVAVAILMLRAKPRDDHNYTEDEFFGIRWRWRWSAGSVVNLVHYCLKCDRIIPCSDNWDTTLFICEPCHSRIPLRKSFEDVKSAVLREIDHKLRTKTLTACMPDDRKRDDAKP
jgi:hypothetical protein